MIKPTKVKVSRSMQAVMKYAEEHGWYVLRHPKDHVKLVHPDHPIKVTCAVTPGCARAWRNAISDIRRQNLAIAQNKKQATACELDR